MGQELRVVACGYYAFGATFPPLAVDAAGKFELSAGDIEIGAVEIKDASSNVRCVVTDTAPAGTEYGLVTRVAGTIAATVTGVATETTLSALNVKVTACDTSDLALETGGNLATIAGDTTSIDGKITACDTSGLALETGGNLATLAAIDFALESGGNLAGAASSLSSIDGKITGCDTSGLALETGGNLASAAGSLTTLAAVDFALETGGNLAAAAGSLSSIDGKVTACDTSGLALETGGNLASAAGSLTTLAAVDFAVETGGNLAAAASSLSSIDGKITGCNTSGLALETGGNLATLVAVDFATDTTLGDVVTAVEAMDDWDEGDRAKVNVIAGQAGIAAGAGAVGATVPRVTLASDDPAVAHLSSIKSTDGIKKITDALPTGTNSIGRVNPEPQSANGCSTASYIGAASDNPNVVKASAGNVYGIVCFNKNASPVYLKLYNKASAPTNADTPIKRYMIPGNANGAGFVIVHPMGVYCSAGIAIRLVTGMADNDNTSVTASEQLVNIDYK